MMKKKKLLAIMVLGLVWTSSGFADSVDGNCTRWQRYLTRSRVEMNMSANLKTVNLTEKVFLHILMEACIWENLQMVQRNGLGTQVWANGMKYVGVNIKTIKRLVKVLLHTPVEVNM